MEKPARILRTEKTHTFSERIGHGLEHALNFMLASPEDAKVKIGSLEPFLMPVETYLSAFKKKSVLIKIYAENDFKGELYWFFELNTAIILSALMRMLPSSALTEKLANGIFDESDQDSFGEVGNQLCGILDRAFRTLTKKDIHLRMDFEKKIFRDENIKLENFANTEEYVVLLGNISFPGHPPQKITLLIPTSLYGGMMNIEVELEGIQKKVVLLHSWKEERVEKLKVDLTSRYTRVEMLDKIDEILEKGATPNLIAWGLDLKGLQFPLTLRESILFKRLAANRLLTQIPHFITFDGINEASAKEFAKIGLNPTLLSLEKDFCQWLQNLAISTPPTP